MRKVCHHFQELTDVDTTAMKRIVVQTEDLLASYGGRFVDSAKDQQLAVSLVARYLLRQLTLAFHARAVEILPRAELPAAAAPPTLPHRVPPPPDKPDDKKGRKRFYEKKVVPATKKPGKRGSAKPPTVREVLENSPSVPLTPFFGPANRHARLDRTVVKACFHEELSIRLFKAIGDSIGKPAERITSFTSDGTTCLVTLQPAQPTQRAVTTEHQVEVDSELAGTPSHGEAEAVLADDSDGKDSFFGAAYDETKDLDFEDLLSSDQDDDSDSPSVAPMEPAEAEHLAADARSDQQCEEQLEWQPPPIYLRSLQNCCSHDDQRQPDTLVVLDRPSKASSVDNSFVDYRQRPVASVALLQLQRNAILTDAYPFATTQDDNDGPPTLGDILEARRWLRWVVQQHKFKHVVVCGKLAQLAANRVFTSVGPPVDFEGGFQRMPSFDSSVAVWYATHPSPRVRAPTHFGALWRQIDEHDRSTRVPRVVAPVTTIPAPITIVTWDPGNISSLTAMATNGVKTTFAKLSKKSHYSVANLRVAANCDTAVPWSNPKVWQNRPVLGWIPEYLRRAKDRLGAFKVLLNLCLTVQQLEDALQMLWLPPDFFKHRHDDRTCQHPDWSHTLVDGHVHVIVACLAHELCTFLTHGARIRCATLFLTVSWCSTTPPR